MGYDKTRVRMEQAIRLELTNLGLTDAEIAEHIGLTPNGYAQMKLRPEYKKLRTTFVTGALSDLDIDLAESRKDLKHMLKAAVPVALQTLVAAALDRSANPKLALQASAEILDREGTFVKSSRIIATEDEDEHASKISGRDDAIANDLIKSLEDSKLRVGPLEKAKNVTEKVQ